MAQSEHNEDIFYFTKDGQFESTLKNMLPTHIEVLKEHWRHFDPKQLDEQVHTVATLPIREETGLLLNRPKYFWPIRRLRHGLYQAEVKFDALPVKVQVEVHKDKGCDYFGTFPIPEIYNGRCCMKFTTTEQFRETWYVIFYAEDKERREVDYEVAIFIPGETMPGHPNSLPIGRIGQ
ncbi:hypothetical protein BGZ61DRAFT_485807 [Ilyonectria robusta]|uniref:uncharacterized protein n=1 Tax=Ilyonectria robusta TaxID=1079257 RepID=UPI001E8E5A03|nr:uncharacterized protein BGZ61DRAFT_485807 [Ilyonectria robusta]KAH8659619.1 hypothetical protein BGZ61DRAFT_485807 [Ilyonectria robusta]